MKVFIVADQVCVEVAKDYLLVIMTREAFDKLSIAEQLDKIREVMVDFNYLNLDTRSMSVN